MSDHTICLYQSPGGMPDRVSDRDDLAGAEQNWQNSQQTYSRGYTKKLFGICIFSYPLPAQERQKRRQNPTRR